MELKSLLIRVKNKKLGKDFSTDKNNLINKYIKWHTKLSNKKYLTATKKKRVRQKLSRKIVEFSEITNIDDKSYEIFGKIILLMIKNIIKSPKFSGYTYRDDFYSDATHKILKYLHNFDHTLISERTNLPVNAFAYISQYIHNSIIFIIKHKKKEQNNVKKQICFEKLNHNLEFNIDSSNESTFEFRKNRIEETINLSKIEKSLIDEIEKLHDLIKQSDDVTIIYPADYRISFDEYDKLKPILKGKIKIIQERKE